jgi:ATP-dependent RNA helicase SUPV3L1/SUV3
MASRRDKGYFDTAELLDRGWTLALIERFLGSPDRQDRNRSDASSAPVQWYGRHRVLAAEQDARIARALRRVEQRRERKSATAGRQRLRDFSQFKEYFPLARALERRFVFFCGPTNSGKTYQALNALCGHASGAYLAPLRLLALEGQEEIERRGKPCSLLTGDERDIKPDARFRAQTIESLNYEEEVDAILIDEVQMLVDEQRGEHWVSALIGAPAATIYLAGSPEALGYVEQICTYVDGALEVHRTERLAPLDVDVSKRSLDEALAPKGRKAFIVFSRQAVFDLKDAVDEHGQQAAVIYGSLGPAVRRKEAARFRSGECPVLIATDAIGMGLNLPIDHLYFVATDKWDGKEVRPLSPSELRQIAGRSGRYGKSRTGLVGAVFAADLERVRRAVEAPPLVLPVRRLNLGLTLPLAEEVAELRNTESLAQVMEFFAVMKDSSGLFRPRMQAQAVRLAALLDEHRALPFDEKYRLAFAPVNTDDPLLFEEYRRHVEQLVRHGRIDFAADVDNAAGTRTLIEAERTVKLYTLRLWFAFQYGDDADVALLEQQRDAANMAIEGFLRARAREHRRRCRSCGRMLPRFSPYALCQACYASGRRA